MTDQKNLFALVMLAAVLLVSAQNAVGSSTPVAASAATNVPSLVRYAGTAALNNNKLPASATFLIFRDEAGGTPLWGETQTVLFNAGGHFEIYLGAATPSGLPAELFATGEARWLEVQIPGEATQARLLLASVPYAMKAADAATLGGLPASAFALAGSTVAAGQAANAPAPDATAHTVTTTDGTSGYLPVFSGATTIDDSIVFESGTRIGIGTKAPAATLDIEGAVIARGLLTLESNGTATASGGKDSQALAFTASAYNSSTKKVVTPLFTLQAEPATNNTSTPGATLNLLYGNGGTPAETGFSISSKGLIKFASGQTFPGIGGSGGTITGITTSSPLAGSGTKGSIALSLNLSALESSLNSTYARLGAADNFTSPVTFAVGQTFSGFSSGGDGVVGTTGGSAINAAGVLGKAGPASGITDVAAGVWGDAYTQVGVEGTSHASVGVYGQSVNSYGVQGVSSINNGVQGTTSGNTLNTAGVLGGAGARTSFRGIAGVWGDADAHVGVFGSSNSFSGVQGSSTTNNGVFGSSISGPGVSGSSNTSHAGQFSNDGSAATVYAVNAAAAGGSAMYATTAGTDGEAIYAYAQGGGAFGITAYAPGGTDSSGGEPAGVFGYSSGTGMWGNSVGNDLNTAGVLGSAGARTGAEGIAGVWGDAAEHIGVYGTSNVYPGVLGSSGNGYGVEGTSASAIGVYGYSAGASNTGQRYSPIEMAGVWGDTSQTNLSAAVLGTADDTFAGFFINYSANNAALYAFNDGGGDDIDNVSGGVLEAGSSKGSCGIGRKGDLACTGQVKMLATTGGGARTVETYAMQSPENWMEDFGSGDLQNGVATVSLDAGFADTVSESAAYHVFLTPRGDSKGLYVTKVTAGSFEVRESGGGSASIGFDYRIVAKRRGFERQRMTDVTESFRAEQARNQNRVHPVNTPKQGAQHPLLPAAVPGAPQMRLPRPPVEIIQSQKKAGA